MSSVLIANVISFLSKNLCSPHRNGKQVVQDCESSWKDFPLVPSNFAVFIPRTLFPTHHIALFSLPLSCFFFRVRELGEWLILRPRSSTWGEKCCHIKAVRHSLFALWILHALFPRQLMWVCRHCSLGQYACTLSFLYTTKVHSHLCLKQRVLYYWIHKQNTTWILDKP